MPGIKLPPLPQGYSERPWYYEGGLFTQGQMYYYATAALESPEVQALREDAERYWWLRNESWAGYNQSKRKPQVAETIVFVQDGAGNVKTILAEDALDAAIDAAMEKQK